MGSPPPAAPGAAPNRREEDEQVLGLRVVRGPDWSWSNQDGGEGHLGTVIEVGSPGQTSPELTVVVSWDNGMKTNYRVGYHHAYDLRIFDNGPVGVEHCGSLCCACESRDIKGFKWRCTRCLVDLCSTCYFADCHDVKHQFFRFDTPSSVGFLCPPRLGGSRVTAKGLFANAKVIRGVDWEWGDQDGWAPTGVDLPQGKITQIRGWEDETFRSVASVVWPSNSNNVYRVGHKGKVDLKCVKPTKGGNYYPEHLPVLDIRGQNGGGSGRASLDLSVVGDVFASGGAPGPLDSPLGATGTGPPHLSFTLGERVKVSLEQEVLKALQEGHGGWNPKMNEVIDRIGSVHRITEKGDVRIIYDNGQKWTFHAAALTKVPLFQEGDFVKITKNIAHLQEQGSSNDEAIAIAGKVGQIKTLTTFSTVSVQVADRLHNLHVNCLQPSQPISSGNNLPVGANPDLSPLGAQAADPNSVSRLEQFMKAIQDGNLEAVSGFVSDSRSFLTCLFENRKQPIHVATNEGHVNIVEFLMKEGVSCNVEDLDGDSPLHLAIYANKCDVLKFLAEQQDGLCDVNKQNARLQTPLHCAVNRGLSPLVDIFVENGADPNVVDANGETAIFEAITKGRTELACKLLRRPNVNYMLRTIKDVSYLHQTLTRGNAEVAKELLELCPDLVNVGEQFNKFTALHMASLCNNEQFVRLLLDNGANPNQLSTKNVNPLMFAVGNSSPKIVSWLLEAGTDINQLDSEGNNCLPHLLHPQNRSKMMEYQSSELTPDMKEIEVLLKKNNPTVSREALLACFLISKGIKYKGIKNKQGKAPLHLARDEALVELIESFIKENTCDFSVSAECRMCGKPANCQFKPCGHVIACEDCADFFKKCYVCKVQVEGHKKLTITIQKMCGVCDENEANVRFQPCSHFEVCQHCAVRMKKCIKCQTLIEAKLDMQGGDLTAKLASDGAESSSATNMELRELKARLEQMEDAALCQICIERPKNTVFMCGHAFCHTCAREVTLCPVCRRLVTRVINIYSG